MADRSVNIAVTAKEKTKSAVKAAQGHLKALEKAGVVSANKITGAFAVARKEIVAFSRRVGSAISEMRGKLLAGTAAVVGIGYALKKTFDFAKLGAVIDVQRKAFENLAKSYSVSGTIILGELKEISKGAVSTAELVGSASRALLLGIAPDKLTRMMEIARAASKATGDTIAKSFEDIALGVGRQSKMILDNLGIIVDVETANKKYAEQLGKVASLLTEDEKKAAFLNETLIAGKNIIDRVGNSTADASDKLNIIATSFKEAKEKAAGFFKTLIIGESVKNNLDDINIAVKQGTVSIAEAQRQFQNLLKSIDSGFLFGNRKLESKQLTPLQERIKDEEARLKAIDELLKAQGISTDKEAAARAKGLLKIIDDIQIKNQTARQQGKGDFLGIFGQKELFEKLKEAISKDFDLLDKESQVAFLALQKRFADVKTATNDAGKAAKKMSRDQVKAIGATAKAYEQTARNIHDTISNLLFSRLTKRGQDFRDTMINIFRDIGDNIVRMFTNAASTAAMNMLGINQMLGVGGGGQGGTGIVGAARVIQTSAGGVSNLGANAPIAVSSAAGTGVSAGAGGRISSAVSQTGMGAVTGAGQRILQNPNMANLRQTLPVGIAAGQGLFSQGGIGSPASMLRLGVSGAGAVLRRLPYTPFPTRLGGTAANIIGRGSTLLKTATGIGGSIGGLLSSLAPIGSLGRGRGSGLGGSIGSIGGALLGAPFGGIGAGIGSFLGGGLGRITGGILGRGRSNRNLNFGIGVPGNLSGIGIPTSISASRFRDFGPQMTSAASAFRGERGKVVERAEKLGLGKLSEVRLAQTEIGLPSSPADFIARIQDRINKLSIAKTIVEGVEGALENAIKNGISAGFEASTASRGFDIMTDTIKSTIMGNITNAIVAAISETSMFKSAYAQAIVPVTKFIQSQAGKDTFDAEGLKTAVSQIGTIGGLGEAKKTFDTLFTGIRSLEEKLFGEKVGGAEAIRIPRLDTGGVITKSGLAFVDKGESFSGVRKSRTELFNNNGDNGGIYIDLKGANINLSSQQNVNAVAQELGRRTRLEINKPRQFSTL